MEELTCSLITLQCRVTKMCEIIAIIEPSQEIVAVVEAVTVEVASLNEIELLKIYEQAKEDYYHGKTTQSQPTNNGQSFAYAVGQDIAALKAAVENLTHNQQEDDKQSQLLKVVIPATIGKYTETFTQVEVPLPEEFRNAICIEYFEQDDGSSVTLLNTEKTLFKPIGDVEQVYYIKKLMGLEEFKSADVKVATISQEALAKINQEIEAKRQ